MTLKQVITQHDPGTWLAISRDGKVLGSASSADKARRTAGSRRAAFLVFLGSPKQAPQDGNGRDGNAHSVRQARKAQLNLPSFYRGVYKRVADQLGVDPSYVSRVARGERTSHTISRALENELKHSLASAQSRRVARAAAA
jgi:hypothetical protein